MDTGSGEIKVPARMVSGDLQRSTIEEKSTKKNTLVGRQHILPLSGCSVI